MARKLPTKLEVSQMAERGEDLLQVDAYLDWNGKPVYRKKWTRVRPGLYRRIIGEYEILVEECYDEICYGDKGWIVRWTPLWIGNPSYEGQSEFPYTTAKKAKASAEEDFTGRRLDNPKRATNPGVPNDLVARLKF